MVGQSIAIIKEIISKEVDANKEEGILTTTEMLYEITDKTIKMYETHEPKSGNRRIIVNCPYCDGTDTSKWSRPNQYKCNTCSTPEKIKTFTIKDDIPITESGDNIIKVPYNPRAYPHISINDKIEFVIKYGNKIQKERANSYSEYYDLNEELTDAQLGQLNHMFDIIKIRLKITTEQKVD